MRYQALFLEYILLLILSIFLLTYTISWFYNYKSDIFSSFLVYSNKLIEKQLVYKMELLESFVNSSKYINTKNFIVYCNGPLLIVESGIRCEPTTNDTQFSGYILGYTNDLYWIYSNSTNTYYLSNKIAPNTFKSCYESKISYILNTTQCNINQPCAGCLIVISKQNDVLTAEIYK